MSKILLKRSDTIGAIPSQLDNGEIACNTSDKKLFLGTNENVVDINDHIINIHLLDTNYLHLSSTQKTIATQPATSTVDGYMTSSYASKLDGIAENANNYSLPLATSTTVGGIELFSDVVQTVASNHVTATDSRTYGIQINSSGQAVVNVPWSDTNTTYTAASSVVTETSYGLSSVVGTSANYARQDHSHGTPVSTKDTTAITGILKGNGTAISAAIAGTDYAAANQTMYIGTTAVAINRSSGALALDGLTLITPNIGVATGTSFNSITGLATAVPISPAVTAVVGTSTLVARQDHVHPTNFTSTVTDIKMNGTQSVGILTTFPRADHVHPIDSSRLSYADENSTSLSGDTLYADVNLCVSMSGLSNRELTKTITQRIQSGTATILQSTGVKDNWFWTTLPFVNITFPYKVDNTNYYITCEVIS